MGRRRKVTTIAEKVAGILGRDEEPKKLTKETALKRFIQKMEARRKDIKSDLKKGSLKSRREKLLRRHVDTLDQQIKKARKILRDMSS